MATTKSAMLMIKLSSSYVLIITTPSTGFSEWVGARPPATLVNTLFSCSPATVGQETLVISVLVLAHRGGFLFTLMFHFLADAILLGISHIDELYCFVKILFNNLFYFV